ncbi:MAG: hypothetical protein HKL88_09760 [Bacteroidia bacterium]|jgi:cytochrome c biogenesis protein CcdA|nr:hypothetical protein [Bacteroidia bacterium]
MEGDSLLQKVYLFVGGIFSVFYIVAGLFISTGRISFGMQPSVRFLFGAGIIAYGIFRAFMFYKKYKAAKNSPDQ